MSFRYRALPAGLGFIVLASFCGELRAETRPRDLPRAQALRDRIVALSSQVRVDEAKQVADCAYATAEQLRRDYGVIGGPPSLQNFLVNLGIRKRGLCFQWAEDLLVRLDALKLTTLELHWAEAWVENWREHNCVVVTAKGQPFRQGIILDCWRHSGRLFWSALASDHYPWVEDSRYAEIARSTFAAKRKSRLDQEQPVSANEKGSTITASTR
jgi:hypothetical protein